MEPQNEQIIAAQPIKTSVATTEKNPGNRINHIVAVYDNKIFVLGGISSCTPAIQDHHLNVYCFNLLTNSWSKKKFYDTDNKQQDAVTRSFMASTKLQNKLYLFGGSNSHNECTNELLCLDMNEMSWDVVKNVNAPAPRQSAKMQSLKKKKIIILYGGVNLQKMTIFQNIHIYQIESGNWIQCLGSYSTIIKPRYQSNICLIDQAMYLFGGEYRTPDNIEYFLNDFYKIIIKQSQKNKWTAEAQLIRLSNHIVPQSRSGHFLLPYKNQFIILLGGQNIGQQSMVSTWIYSVKSNQWKKFQLSQPIAKSYGFNCCISQPQQKLFLFGGINTHDSVKVDLYSLYLTIDIQKYFPPKTLLPCKACKYHSQAMKLNKFEADKYSELVDFPYAAIGLLLECSDYCHADEFNIKHRFYQSNAYLEIVQNNDLNYTFDQLKNSIMNYQSNLNFNPMGTIQKKVKNAINKDNFLKQFGLFIKIAAFRLGNQFIYLMIKQNQFWVFCYLDEGDQYCHFYAFAQSLIDNSIIRGTEKDKNAIKKYQQLIDNILKKKMKNKDPHSHQNYLLILDLKKIKMQNEENSDEIIPSQNGTDLIISTYSQNSYFRRLPHILSQSIDISLKTYLSLFFLKLEHMVIKLQIFQKWYTIIPQMFLQKYDQMVKFKMVSQIDNSLLNIELKIMELYFNPNLKNPTSAFQNGVLIYHRGRLVQRYGCPLGQIFLKSKIGMYNWFCLFGLLQVPQTVQVNIFRTDFAYNVMMEKLRSKLKYLQTHIAVNYDRKPFKVPKTIKQNSRGEHSQFSQFSADRGKSKKQERSSKKSDKIFSKVNVQKNSNMSQMISNELNQPLREQIQEQNCGKQIQQEQDAIHQNNQKNIQDQIQGIQQQPIQQYREKAQIQISNKQSMQNEGINQEIIIQQQVQMDIQNQTINFKDQNLDIDHKQAKKDQIQNNIEVQQRQKNIEVQQQQREQNLQIEPLKRQNNMQIVQAQIQQWPKSQIQQQSNKQKQQAQKCKEFG